MNYREHTFLGTSVNKGTREDRGEGGAQELRGARATRAQAREVLRARKTELQAQMTASMLNAKRLFTLTADAPRLSDELREALAA
jgi:hypothetical protein